MSGRRFVRSMWSGVAGPIWAICGMRRALTNSSTSGGPPCIHVWPLLGFAESRRAVAAMAAAIHAALLD